jgi:hypothetical protein
MLDETDEADHRVRITFPQSREIEPQAQRARRKSTERTGCIAREPPKKEPTEFGSALGLIEVLICVHPNRRLHFGTMTLTGKKPVRSPHLAVSYGIAGILADLASMSLVGPAALRISNALSFGAFALAVGGIYLAWLCSRHGKPGILRSLLSCIGLALGFLCTTASLFVCFFASTAAGP